MQRTGVVVRWRWFARTALAVLDHVLSMFEVGGGGGGEGGPGLHILVMSKLSGSSPAAADA